MANPGYGKRSTPDQLRATPHDFAHLPPREAAIAAYLDRLPDGADISVKTLARQLPYGQCALSTALNRIQQAGHLRRGRECVTADDGSSRWITRSWWSRTARDDDWWTAFTRGDVPQAPQRPTRSRAQILLAALGRTAPVLSLSQTDCAALAPAPRPPLRVLECANCGTPGRPESLPGGRCSACRGESAPAQPLAPLPAPSVHDHAARIRAAMDQRRQERLVRTEDNGRYEPRPADRTRPCPPASR
ncbi:hypothetical protein ACFW2V_10205 [Streptomyces sp. NPDC058947]|uniref:hypothetical protein n=1 Tax=Streptomyces sp. NPDC058947 TaxID=3346675 RepID=UPI0036B52789